MKERMSGGRELGGENESDDYGEKRSGREEGKWKRGREHDTRT